MQSSPIVQNFSKRSAKRKESPNEFEIARKGLQTSGQIPKISFPLKINNRDSKTLSSLLNKKNKIPNLKVQEMQLMPSLLKNVKQKKMNPSKYMAKYINVDENSNMRPFTTQDNCFYEKKKMNLKNKQFSQQSEMKEIIPYTPFENDGNGRLLKKYFHFSLKKKNRMKAEGIRSLYKEGKQKNTHDYCKSEKKIQFLHKDFGKFKSHKFMHPDNEGCGINKEYFNQAFNNNFNHDFQDLDDDFEFEYYRPNLISVRIK